jgi:hypothetical protein
MPVSPDHPSAPTRNDRPGARPRGLSISSVATAETEVADSPSNSAFVDDGVIDQAPEGGMAGYFTLTSDAMNVLNGNSNTDFSVVISYDAIDIIKRKLNDDVASRFHTGVFRHMLEEDIEKFMANNGVLIFEDRNKVYALYSGPDSPQEFFDAIKTVVAQTVQELKGEPVAARLDFGEEVVNNRSTLSGPDDDNLTFYEEIEPVFSLDEIRATPMPINNTVFDPAAHEDVSLTDFMLAGNKLVFLFAGKQTGISYTSLIKTIKNGDGIFYECTREVSSSEITEGKYGFHEVYSQPYIEVLSRFYVTLDEFQKLLRVPVHPYWEIKDTGKTLPVTASRLNLAIRAPVQSQLHCQAGSDLKVYTIEPYMPQIDKDEEESACDVPQIVTLQRGEVRTQVDISENNTVIGAKEWYARENALEVAKLRFIFRGKVMSDDGVLTPGTVVMVMIIPDRPPPEEQEQDQPPEGARRTRRRRRRNTNKNTRHR